MISIYNTAKLDSSSNREVYSWTIMVEDKSSQVKSVAFHLHPTFKPSKVQLTKKPFQLTRKGWGTFDIACDVAFQNGLKAKYTHELSFESSSPIQTYPVPTPS